MNSRIVWIGAVLVVGLALAAWFLRNPAAEGVAQTGASAGPAGARAGAQPAPAPAPGATVPSNSAQAGSHPNEKGNGNSTGSAAAARPAQKDPRINAQERAFIAKLFEPPGPGATDLERQLWDESPVSDLLYPQGHPCAGQPLDSTSPGALTEAAVQALNLENMPDADVPQCVYQGNWPFHPLNQTCSSVNPKDPDSVARCTNYLLSAPQDPQAYPATIWLPCADSSQATTRRAYLESLIRDQVDRIFAGPRCTAG